MSEEIKRNYQKQLGVEFGEIFYRLEVHWVYGLLRIKEFRELFGDPERVELLNAVTGGAFLWDVQQIFWDDLILRVTRLTESSNGKGKERLTVKQLSKLLCNSNDPVLLSKLKQHPTLCSDVAQQVESACQSAKAARKYRNLHIGHNDLTSDLNAQAKPLEGVSLHDVQVSLDAVHGILNTISKRLLDREITNDVVIKPRGVGLTFDPEPISNPIGRPEQVA